MRPSIRFEIFKRDGFTCAYCGRKPPAVTLEVDHIIPRAEGGDDAPENLATSCWDCNRGKGATMLDQRAPVPVPDLEERAELIRERERQLREYHAAKAEERERRDRDFKRVWDHWFDLWGQEELARWHTPWEGTLRTYIDTLGPEDVMEAMEIARGRFNYISSNAVKYFAGICKRKVAEMEGRVRVCPHCKKRLVLEPEQMADDRPGLNWYHGECFEATGG
jgi:DNA-directed RNA polymerase subunit RPC12/RpoP